MPRGIKKKTMRRLVPEGTKAARAAPRSRALVNSKADDGTPFGWFVLEEEGGESLDVALAPYLDPPNRMWRYRTTEDAYFYDMSRADAVEEVHHRLSKIKDDDLRDTYLNALHTAFRLMGDTVRRHSDPDADATLVRGMVRAGLLRVDGVRGWAHPTMRRPDGGVHRREVVALDPSAYLKSERALSTSPKGGSGGPRRPPKAPGSARRGTPSSVRRVSSSRKKSSGARRRRISSPGSKRTPTSHVARAMSFDTP